MSKKFSLLPDCRHYHPSSELRTQDGTIFYFCLLSKLTKRTIIHHVGYYPNISPKQLSAAAELICMIEQHGLNINTDGEEEFLKVLRFLRARKFNVAQAFEMLRSDIEWREQDNRLNLRRETAKEILQCDPSEVYKYFPTWIQGINIIKSYLN